ncbi:MAG TPA: hypothetical protein PLA30_06260 [Smithellaceae bacterium]|jgi:hypothetical protein|nr:hypothetical protein [Smithellaceae bacterium]HOR63042.1 hypothetical protein [Smithellaceae bacterium]HPO22496.1 hypothetical protein [Smithellaceae bacterium]HQK90732.1 hypothetical protein [Smithellaceae bacterium]
MGEGVADDLRIFDESDDTHDALTFWTDQGIDLVYFLNQPRPAISGRKRLFERRVFSPCNNSSEDLAFRHEQK